MSRVVSSVDLGVYVTPTAAAVARLVESHGLDATGGRWYWMGKRTLLTLAQQGRAVATGVAPTVRRSRSYSPEDAAVAIEASFLLGSTSGGERAAGLTPNVGRGAIFARGLVPPAITPEERGRVSRLGQAANTGDVAAIGDRDARRAEEQAIGSVLRRALSLVPSQPATGRYRLPPCDDALAGECPVAVKAVFPDLATPDPTPKEAPVPENTTDVARPRRRAPDEAKIRADHATGATGLALAAAYGISASRLYVIWKSLGLPARGRVLAGSARAVLPPDVQMRSFHRQGWKPVELAAALDVTSGVIRGEWQRLVLSPDGCDSSAGPTAGEGGVAVARSARLSVEDLALAADLVASRSVPAALAVEIVAADRDRIAAYRPALVTVLTPEERALAESAYVELLADWDAPEQRQ